LNWWYIGLTVFCFALVGLSFRMIQPYFNSPQQLTSSLFFYVFIGSIVSGVVSSVLSFKPFKHRYTAKCSDGVHCDEDPQESNLPPSVSNVDSTGVSGSVVLPEYFVLPPGTKLLCEDGTAIPLSTATLCWPAKPQAPVETAPSNSIEKRKQREYFKPCKNQS
jgi:hypothetical protein